MFYLLIFGTAQHDLTGCGTGILGVVLVEKVDRYIRYQAGFIGGNNRLSWDLQGGREFWASLISEALLAQQCFKEITHHLFKREDNCVCVSMYVCE